MKEEERLDKQLHDLIDIIHFTEMISAKIHELLDEAEIYRVVTEEFAKSRQYNVSIMLLTEDGSKLGVAETSLIPEKLRSAEKLTGLQLKRYKIDVNKSNIFHQTVREGKTIHIAVRDIIRGFLPEPLVSLISKFLGYEKKKSILTPLYKKGKIIGAFGMSSTELDEYFIPSVKNLAQHISIALEMADEYAERKKTEEMYKHLVELAPDAIVTVNLRGLVTSTNEATVRLSGYSKDEIVGKHFSKVGFLRARDIPKYLKMLNPILRGRIPPPFEVPYIRKNGTTGWVEAHISLLREGVKEISIQAILRDITERKKAEEELIRLSNAVKMSTDSIVISDLDGKIIDVNEDTLKMYGTEDKGDLIGKNSFDLIAPEDGEGALEGMKEVLRGGYVTGREYHIIIKDGSKILGEMNSALMKGGEGKPIGFVGITRDITERKRMEERLSALHSSAVELASAENFEDVVNTTLQIVERVLGFDWAGIAVVDGEVVRYIRHIGAELPEDASIPPDRPSITVRTVKTGRSQLIRDTRLDPDYFRLLPIDPDRPQNLSELAVPTVVDGRVEAVINLESQRVNAFTEEDQRLIETLAMHVASALRRLKEMERLEALVEERTRDLKEAQEQLIRTERLAAIGETATMVGHDLRNPLQAITNAVYLLKRSAGRMESALRSFQGEIDSLPEPLRFKIHGEVEEVVQERLKRILVIDESVKYANKIVSDLQDYARPMKLDPFETSLHQLIGDTLSTLTVPENVKVLIVIPEEVPRVIVDRESMRRVLINLITNAFQAMPKGGELTIRAYSSTGKDVAISIEDTGLGIPEENLPKLFQPLFTTKSKGTGFGLAVCKRLVEVHGGSIEVESQVGKGSIFTIKIP